MKLIGGRGGDGSGAADGGDAYAGLSYDGDVPLVDVHLAVGFEANVVGGLRNQKPGIAGAGGAGAIVDGGPGVRGASGLFGQRVYGAGADGTVVSPAFRGAQAEDVTAFDQMACLVSGMTEAQEGEDYAFAVVLTGSIASTVAVTWSIRAAALDSGFADADVSLASGTAPFDDAGVRAQQVTIGFLSDTRLEGDEDFTLVIDEIIGSGNAVGLGSASLAGTIVDVTPETETPPPPPVDTGDGDAAPEQNVIRGTRRDERLVGSGNDDLIIGKGGSDKLIARAGDDDLR